MLLGPWCVDDDDLPRDSVHKSSKSEAEEAEAAGAAEGLTGGGWSVDLRAGVAAGC